jgi:predicted DNA-binding transcriptional regulator AlpA
MPKYIRTPEAANYVGLSKSQLEKLRLRGTGPAYSKLGKIALYAVADLDDWVASSRRMSTSEPAKVA